MVEGPRDWGKTGEESLGRLLREETEDGCLRGRREGGGGLKMSEAVSRETAEWRRRQCSADS